MRFNPEDNINSGPRCRNCHKGSSGCGTCHNNDPAEGHTTDSVEAASTTSRTAITYLFSAMMDAMNINGGLGGPDSPATQAVAPLTMYKMTTTDAAGGNIFTNTVAQAMVPGGVDPFGKSQIVKRSRTATWTNADWRSDEDTNASSCSDDGLSWPHRTLGWKMLKDDLFGIDVVGDTSGNQTPIAVGMTRTFAGLAADKNDGTEILATASVNFVTHDLDSVCLDCHNPTVWNATAAHVQGVGDAEVPVGENDTGGPNQDLLVRGLP